MFPQRNISGRKKTTTQTSVFKSYVFRLWVSVCVCAVVHINIPCSVFGVVVPRNPLSIFAAYLLISYALLQRPFRRSFIFSRPLFMISLCCCCSLLWVLRKFFVCIFSCVMSVLFHCSNDNNLSISATFRCILKSHDESSLILFC